MDMEENATAPLVGNLSKILSKVLSCLEQGDPVRSEEILRQVLDAKPDNATAWHLRALTAQKMGNLLLAANYFDKAHNLSPENPNYLRDFGAALFAIDQIKEARQVLEKAKKIAPEDTAIRFHLANVQARQQELLAAIDNYEFCIQHNATAYDAHGNLAAAYLHAGRTSEAIKASGRALSICPKSPVALNNLGLALCDANKHQAAIRAFRRALKLVPCDTEIMNNLSVALQAENCFGEALYTLNAAIKLRPKWAEAHINLGNIHREQGNFLKAAEAYRKAIELNPGKVTALANLALALFNLNEFKESERAYKSALNQAPGNADLLMSLGICQLAQGKYKKGWENYESRWEAARFTSNRRSFSAPRWNGEPLSGRRILVHAEQGFGDTLQFCRYIPILTAMGGEVHFECQRPMVSLCRSIEGVEQVLARKDEIPETNFSIPLMSLPRILSTDLDSVPAKVPYLGAKADKIQKFAGFLGNEKRQVGLVWLGNPRRQDDAMRSCPRPELDPILAVPGVTFVSLQVGLDPFDIPSRVTNLGSHFKDFSDTAAAIASLDLVITVDTATAHLAGAIGKPVWVMLAHHADWRYLVQRTDSPWYPTMRLFRQSKRGDWARLTRSVAVSLREWIDDINSQSS
ncbi:MAG: tetratricopeptide repeat protein [Pseudomonadota bacterium]|nr:tetratricopeptide repeat protein [Pseudomonadota bacterium]